MIVKLQMRWTKSQPDVIKQVIKRNVFMRLLKPDSPLHSRMSAGKLYTYIYSSGQQIWQTELKPATQLQWDSYVEYASWIPSS